MLLSYSQRSYCPRYRTVPCSSSYTAIHFRAIIERTYAFTHTIKYWVLSYLFSIELQLVSLITANLIVAVLFVLSYPDSVLQPVQQQKQSSQFALVVIVFLEVVIGSIVFGQAVSSFFLPLHDITTTNIDVFVTRN